MAPFTDNIVLFDLDGTLTPPRESIGQEVITSLINLSEHTKIGVLSGSGYDYITEQLKSLFKVWNKELHILGCNGTQYHTFDGLSKSFNTINSASMKDLLRDDYKDLTRVILENQLDIIDNYNIPLTGHYFSFRNSMVNWCPIGRSASISDRERFVELDSSEKIREYYLAKIQDAFAEKGLDHLTITLGGETSFDIYPNGWDKTYALQFFETVFFVGDRCEKTGNDFAICEALRERCFKTSGPIDTVDIINKVLIPILSNL
tara:strand:+ start:2330 stop:3112 length:783 start_codon:yes stop_codon:yes gene_type:complete